MIRTLIISLLLFIITSSTYAYYDDEDYPPQPEFNYQAQEDDNYFYEPSFNERESRRYEHYSEYDDNFDDSYERKYRPKKTKQARNKKYYDRDIDDSPLANAITAPLEKVIIVDPRKHAWGAYDPSGRLLRWGLATAGASWCRDTGRPCRTKVGSFRMYSLGDETCISKRYPLPDGGAPMPYCMFFNGNEAIHGSYEVVYGNASHGCVRVNVGDAEWLRYQFVEAPNAANGYRGTKVVIKPY